MIATEGTTGTVTGARQGVTVTVTVTGMIREGMTGEIRGRTGGHGEMTILLHGAAEMMTTDEVVGVLVARKRKFGVSVRNKIRMQTRRPHHLPRNPTLVSPVCSLSLSCCCALPCGDSCLCFAF